MSLFTFQDARSAYNEWRVSEPNLVQKSASRVLLGEAQSFESRIYDVFLSHSHLDSEVVLGVCRILRKRFQLDVYVDLDEDDLGDGKRVSPAVAERLRNHMNFSRALIYAASENSPLSRWMPWELGYFDGLRGTVATLPLSDDKKSVFNANAGLEYLGLYPYIDEAPSTTGGRFLWVNGLEGGPMMFRRWISTARSRPG